jgi:hypothetical protein
VLASLVLALPALAHAATYCVNSPGCAGTSEPDLQSALDAAAATATQADTVDVGNPGPPISGGYHYTDSGNAANQVAIVGAARTTTVLKATSGSGSGLYLNGTGSTASHLTVQAPQGGGYGMQTNGSLSDVDITSADPGTGAQTGVYFYGPNSTWTGGTLTLASGSGIQTGTYASTPGVSYTLQDVTVNAEDTGVFGAQGSMLLRRVRIASAAGIQASGEHLVADNLTFVATGSNAFTFVQSTGTLDSTVSLNHVSAFGPGATSDGVIATSSNPGRSVTATVRNSVFRNFLFSLYRNADGSGASTNVSVSYSDIDLVHTTNTNTNGGSGGITLGPGNLDTDPLWLGAPAGNFSLKPASPVIDAGDPAGLVAGDSATDVLGQPRSSNGRQDMGAVEFQQPPPPVVDKTPPTFKTSKLPKKLRFKRLLAGLTFTVNPSEPAAFDATLAGAARSVKLAKTYNVTISHRALKLAPGRRRITLKVRRKLFGKSRKFTLRLTLVATDAAGNKTTKRSTIKVRK